jgi:hypothetical protein
LRPSIYRAAEFENESTWIWCGLSAVISAVAFLWLHCGWLAISIGQVGLFIGITIFGFYEGPSL